MARAAHSLCPTPAAHPPGGTLRWGSCRRALPLLQGRPAPRRPPARPPARSPRGYRRSRGTRCASRQAPCCRAKGGQRWSRRVSLCCRCVRLHSLHRVAPPVVADEPRSCGNSSDSAAHAAATCAREGRGRRIAAEGCVRTGRPTLDAALEALPARLVRLGLQAATVSTDVHCQRGQSRDAGAPIAVDFCLDVPPEVLREGLATRPGRSRGLLSHWCSITPVCVLLSGVGGRALWLALDGAQLEIRIHFSAASRRRGPHLCNFPVIIWRMQRDGAVISAARSGRLRVDPRVHDRRSKPVACRSGDAREPPCVNHRNALATGCTARARRSLAPWLGRPALYFSLCVCVKTKFLSRIVAAGACMPAPA